MSAQEKDVENNEITDSIVEDTVDENAGSGNAEDDQGATDNDENSLEEKLEAAEAKATENWENFLRAKAEMDNLRRRNAKDIENAHKFGIEKFVNELLPVLDGMGMGLAVEDATAESLREGMALTMSMIEKMMEKLGIEEINPMNEKFDPEKHQAMTMQPNADVEPNTVTAVMQKGYSLNERLIRPAMVMVSKAVDE